jgi:hypothetical protein
MPDYSGDLDILGAELTRRTTTSHLDRAVRIVSVDISFTGRGSSAIVGKL